MSSTETNRSHSTRFRKGERRSPATEFKKGQHAYRKHQPHWDRDWLYLRYVTQGKSAAEIAKETDVTNKNIYYWLDKHGIPRRNSSEARALQPWRGLVGEANPMFGRTGAKNPNWKGGVAPDRQCVYASSAWKKVAKIVRNRDANRCKRCGTSEQKLHIHHVIPFDSAPLLGLSLRNLVLLCIPCHNWVHSKANTDKIFLNEVKVSEVLLREIRKETP